jgi:hypothetical protein
MIKRKQKMCFRRNKVVWIACVLLTSAQLSGQTSKYEDAMATHYFHAWIRNIKSHISPVLSPANQKLLEEIHVILDSTSSEGYTVNSNSDERTITFGVNLVRSLARFTIAQYISFDTAAFNLSRFSGLYTSDYPYLNRSILPEDAAALNAEQKRHLFSVVGTDEFAWKIQGKLLVLFLHEFFHQVQQYSKITAKLSTRYPNKKMREAFLLDLEMSADTFAISTVGKAGLNVTEYMDAFTIFVHVREGIFPTIDQLTKRQINAYTYVIWGMDCKARPQPICEKMQKQRDGYQKLYRHYADLHAKEHLLTMRKKAVAQKNLFDLYNLGDFYFKGTSEHVADMDSAIYFYSLGASVTPLSPATGSGVQPDRQLEIIEYCALLAGKIYEIHKKDRAKAQLYIEKAKSISKMFPAEYYEKIIATLRQ